jgi:hypothetical protein
MHRHFDTLCGRVRAAYGPTLSAKNVMPNDILTTILWRNCQTPLTIVIMGRHLAETTRLLRWKYASLVFALIALLSASSAMAIPGPASDVTGFASVLFVGAIALLAGHAWGILVIATAEMLIVGKVWPIVTSIFTSGTPDSLSALSATTALLTALPGLALFVATLPFAVEVVLGQKQNRAHRSGVVISSVASVLWLLQPMLSL